MLTHERLLELLHYDPATGVWTWRVKRSNFIQAGALAGHIDPRMGRRRMDLSGKKYMSSRLAVFYMTGEWPDGLVDHWNGDPLNDSWSNLREATHQQNQNNKVVSRNSVTGVKGVYRRSNGTYSVQGRVNGRKYCLGTYKTLAKASEAYRKHEAIQHGTFAVTNRQPPCQPIHLSALPTVSSPPLQSGDTNQQSDAPINPS